MRKAILFLALIIITFLVSCKKETKPAVKASEEVSEEIPSDFLQFYMKFHADSLFQMNHIIFPLDVKGDGNKWTEEEWIIHKPFSDLQGDYRQAFRNFGGIILEFVNDNHGYYKMEKRYAPGNDGYNLIYYHVINAFEQSEDWEPGNQ